MVETLDLQLAVLIDGVMPVVEVVPRLGVKLVNMSHLVITCSSRHLTSSSSSGLQLTILPHSLLTTSLVEEFHV